MAEYSNRRREARKEFHSDCSIEIIAPPDQVGFGIMIQGRTINITEHGLMVTIPGLKKEWVDHWAEAVNQDRVILVQASLSTLPGKPLLKGQIVWTHWMDDPDEGPLTSLGLLFQILLDSEIEMLRQLLSGLTTQPDD